MHIWNGKRRCRLLHDVHLFIPQFLKKMTSLGVFFVIVFSNTINLRPYKYGHNRVRRNNSISEAIVVTVIYQELTSVKRSTVDALSTFCRRPSMTACRWAANWITCERTEHLQTKGSPTSQWLGSRIDAPPLQLQQQRSRNQH